MPPYNLMKKDPRFQEYGAIYPKASRPKLYEGLGYIYPSLPIFVFFILEKLIKRKSLDTFIGDS